MSSDDYDDFGGDKRRCNLCQVTLTIGNWGQHSAGRRHRDAAAAAAACLSTSDASSSRASVDSRAGNICASRGNQNSSRLPRGGGSGLVPQRQCPICTLINDAIESSCVACDEDLEGEPIIFATSGGERTAVRCGLCSTSNPSGAKFCVECGNRVSTVATNSYQPGGAKRSPVTTEETCFVCLDLPPTISLLPCRHKVICRTCAPNFVSGWQCSQCHRPASGVDVPGVLSPTAPAAVASASAASSSPQAFPPVPSTFPWMGGDIRKFDEFLAETRRGARAFLQAEIGHLLATRGASFHPADVSGTLLTKFKSAWAGAACPEGVWSGLFGWHANGSAQATLAVSRDGWLPSLRKRNRHGPGEYFGLHHSQVLEYTEGKHASILLGFALRGPHVSWVEDFCFIVNNNPRDDFETLCLPMFVVRIEPSCMEPWSVPRTPFRWVFKWENDDETDFIAFEGPVNMKLNERMCQVYASSATRNRRQSADFSKVKTSLRREGDRKDTDYVIDVVNYTQLNLETQFSRKIDVACVPSIPLPPTLWLMLIPAAPGDNGRIQESLWLPVDMFAQRALCSAHYAYSRAVLQQQQQRVADPQVLQWADVMVNRDVMRVNVKTMVAYATVSTTGSGRKITGNGVPLAIVAS